MKTVKVTKLKIRAVALHVVVQIFGGMRGWLICNSEKVSPQQKILYETLHVYHKM